jgi:hypothetical protein
MPIGRHASHRLARLASFGSSRCGMVTLLKLKQNIVSTAFVQAKVKTDSNRSMISKPFVHRMAILAFKNITSKDSDGKKKSR